MNYFRERALSPAAESLIQFDADSIRRLGEADVWLADPDQYEKDGRLFRDSETTRMLAYSRKDHVLYATDGCNSCARELPAALEELTSQALTQLAQDNEIPFGFLEHLVETVKNAG